MPRPIIPPVGAALAVITGVAMAVAGASWWLALGVVLIWLGSLWLVRPEPVSSETHERRGSSSRDAMRLALEPIASPLILFDRERIVAANAAARAALGAHIVGQDARIALRHPEAIRLLDLDDGASVSISGLTGARSLWQLSRHRIGDRYWLIEMADRTTESDISRAHTDFVANASHELRTPIAAVIGYIETLAEDPSKFDPETVARFHDIVLREARRMQGLVSDLMSLSQLEAEKHDSPVEKIDLSLTVARVVGEFTATIGNARLSYARPAHQVLVAGDERQLSQLMRNLIDNALKYGDADKPVTVALTGDERSALLSVRDEGQGISAEHLPHLTRRFYRTDPGRSRAAGGTGLGLAIVKHIVERHRGRLDIISDIGLGTRVDVRLPIAA